jgi:hypothetical protein
MESKWPCFRRPRKVLASGPRDRIGIQETDGHNIGLRARCCDRRVIQYRALVRKDADASLKAFLKSLADHDWTTQGLIDLALFVGLG